MTRYFSSSETAAFMHSADFSTNGSINSPAPNLSPTVFMAGSSDSFSTLTAASCVWRGSMSMPRGAAIVVHDRILHVVRYGQYHVRLYAILQPVYDAVVSPLAGGPRRIYIRSAATAAVLILTGARRQKYVKCIGPLVVYEILGGGPVASRYVRIGDYVLGVLLSRSPAPP